MFRWRCGVGKVAIPSHQRKPFDQPLWLCVARAPSSFTQEYILFHSYFASSMLSMIRVRGLGLYKMNKEQQSAGSALGLRKEYDRSSAQVSSWWSAQFSSFSVQWFPREILTQQQLQAFHYARLGQSLVSKNHVQQCWTRKKHTTKIDLPHQVIALVYWYIDQLSQTANAALNPQLGKSQCKANVVHTELCAAPSFTTWSSATSGAVPALEDQQVVELVVAQNSVCATLVLVYCYILAWRNKGLRNLFQNLSVYCKKGLCELFIIFVKSFTSLQGCFP